MIKKLLAQLTSGKVSLSTGLKKTKIIITIVEDNELCLFIEKELGGYKKEDELPEYRVVKSTPKGTYRNELTGSKQSIPFTYVDLDSEMLNAIYYRKINLSIPEIEDLLDQFQEQKKGEIVELFPDQLVQLHREITEHSEGWFLESGSWAVPSTALSNIVSRTNNKLIDILIRLLRDFPELDRTLDYMNDDTNDNGKSYLTNIHGDIIGSNFGVGDQLVQKDIEIRNATDAEGLIKAIIGLGFSKTDVQELEEHFKEEKKTGIPAKGKILSWVGKMATKAIEKGIEYKVPTLLDAVSAYVRTHYSM